MSTPTSRNRDSFLLSFLTAVALLAVTLAATPSHAQTGGFALKKGDRVVFYGDSITDQREYTLFTELYVVTRFPKDDIRFIHSGWGGDRVSGGGGGPIDLRLDRDVTAYKPTVVTVMLGMNDASYRAFDEGIFKTYADGYTHLVDKVKKDNPGVRMTLIQPSPYDDVTRPVGFPGGYNAVLLRYSDFVKSLASKTGGMTADLNNPVVAMLTKANTADATLAAKIIPDRVHPGWGGHLIMAESLLKSWNAPALVSSQTLDVASAKATAENAIVSNVKTGGTVSWTTTENALPFPIRSYRGFGADENNAYDLALKSSDFVDALDKEMLTVSGLSAANYTLTIDGQEVGTFSKEQLAAGVNLATMNTPMLRQADLVSRLTMQRANTHNSRWRDIQVPLANDKKMQMVVPATIKGMDAADESLRQAQRSLAQPTPHDYVLTPKS